jgi:Regulator of ribonuclease activity B
MDFPDDDNGDVLRRLVAQGDSLTRPRDIDFVVVFADETSAERFGGHFADLGYAVSVHRVEVAEDLLWDVRVVNHMVPSHQAVGDFKSLLESVAGPLGGRNDGWGCIEQTPDTDS